MKTKQAPAERAQAKKIKQAWLATLPTCTSCTRKILHANGTCIHCRMEQLYGPWDGTVTPAPAIVNTTVRSDADAQ